MGSYKKHGLTINQAEKLRIYDDLCKELGRIPSRKDLASAFGTTRPSVDQWVLRLESRGVTVVTSETESKREGLEQSWQLIRDKYRSESESFMERMGTEPTAADIARSMGVSREAVRLQQLRADADGDPLPIFHSDNYGDSETVTMTLPAEILNVVDAIASKNHTTRRQVIIGAIKRRVEGES